MAQQTDGSKTAELELGNGEDCSLDEDKQLHASLKKTPLRDLQNDSNIVAQNSSGNPLVRKEGIITEAAKASSTKPPFPESPISVTHQQPINSNGGNSHLVYVRRKFEVDASKSSNNDVLPDNANCVQPRQQLSHQEDAQHLKSSTKESQMQCLPGHAPIHTTSLASTVSMKPPGLAACENLHKLDEPQYELVPSAVTTSVHSKMNKDWEERYLQLQLFLQTLDQSSLDDHLQMLRTFSAGDLSRHAVELEKRAIQLSLEQAKELQRVKVLNVLGKSVRTSNGAAEAPSAEH